MEQKLSPILSQHEEELRKIASGNKHGFHQRNPYKIELVRMFGDQVDSRFVVEESGGMLSIHWTLWTESDGEEDSEFPSLEELESVMKKANNKFEEEVKKRGEDPEDW